MKKLFGGKKVKKEAPTAPVATLGDTSSAVSELIWIPSRFISRYNTNQSYSLVQEAPQLNKR